MLWYVGNAAHLGYSTHHIFLQSAWIPAVLPWKFSVDIGLTET